MKLTQEEADKFLNPDGSINARKVRRSCGGRRGRKEGTKSLKNRQSGKAKVSTRTVIRQKYNAVKNFLQNKGSVAF
jgi:hypothetical protein